MRRLGSIGASIFLIFLGVIAIIELILFITTKDHVSRSDYLSGLIFLVIFGLIYYVTFRLLGGWKPSTWDGTNSGLKTLLFIIGFPGLILGSILLVIFGSPSFRGNRLNRTIVPSRGGSGREWRGDPCGRRWSGSLSPARTETLIFIALDIDYNIDNTSAVGYSLSKKKKKVPADAATPPTGEQQGRQGT